VNRTFVSIVGLALACQGGELSAADEAWLGETVMVKETAMPQVGNQRFVFKYVDVPAVVEQVNGDWLWLGNAWVKKSETLRLEEAPAYFTKLIESGNNVTVGYMLRAITWQALNQYESAVNDLTVALRREPTNGFFYRLRGEAQYARHANHAALADYTKALQLNPADLFAMSGRGIALDAIGEYGKSLKQFGELLRIDPRNALAYGNRAGTWWDLDEYEKCLADLNRAIQLDPKLAPAYSNRGRWHMKHGDYTKALADYETAIKLAPREWLPYYGLARIYATAPVFEAHIRDGKKALAMAKKACDLSLWDDWMPISALAAAYAELGDFDAAVRWQTKAGAMPQLANERDRRDDLNRLELYKSGKAYYEDVPPPSDDAALSNGPAKEHTGHDKR
jgi:tetratricopeptide (TPR) repeat protein